MAENMDVVENYMHNFELLGLRINNLHETQWKWFIKVLDVLEDRVKSKNEEGIISLLKSIPFYFERTSRPFDSYCRHFLSISRNLYLNILPGMFPAYKGKFIHLFRQEKDAIINRLNEYKRFIGEAEQLINKMADRLSRERRIQILDIGAVTNNVFQAYQAIFDIGRYIEMDYMKKTRKLVHRVMKGEEPKEIKEVYIESRHKEKIEASREHKFLSKAKSMVNSIEKGIARA